MTETRNPVFTIGHSNHEPEEFLTLLQRHGVDVVVDVRSAPYSRYLPHFNKEHLAETLKQAAIRYSFKGKELGGQPADRAYYDDEGRVVYDRLAATAAFKGGIEYILDTAAVHPSTRSEPAPYSTQRIDTIRGRTAASPAQRLALMCSEKEPLDCHRTLMVAQSLAARGVDVAHIHADGNLETHTDALNRLLDKFKLPHNGDLFRSREAVIDDAVERQTQRVGARWQDQAAGRAEWERVP